MRCKFTIDELESVHAKTRNGVPKLNVTLDLDRSQLEDAICEMLGKLTDAEALDLIMREFPEHFEDAQ